ncbi:hypothetical protein E2F46_16110 [Luteimonas aestuarii]|uniref:Lipoprotein n=1 Tax=Luteimonas aestuarii TaxID=453837 RepID=A0A4R5TSQ7_9GAMM|nr:hypothetical protein [Luteimonas aestuarii]TDK20325.1 hypothetical protein E2F46_16110 [Luteimonas aestuarii]
MRTFLIALLLACATTVLATGCASTGKQVSALDRAQYDWSAAIRWGDFEGAWNLVEPAYREANPMTDLQFERYKQVQVSQYRERSSRPGEAEAFREIEIGLINRHNMTERTQRYTEHWRFDAAAKRWWIVGGLPDFWSGE